MSRLTRLVFSLTGLWGMAYAIFWVACLVLVVVNQGLLVRIIHWEEPIWLAGMIGWSVFIAICLQN